MTSEEYVEELHRNGVKLIKNDGSHSAVSYTHLTLPTNSRV